MNVFATVVNLSMPRERAGDCFKQNGHTSGTRKGTCWTHGVPVARWVSLMYAIANGTQLWCTSHLRGWRERHAHVFLEHHRFFIIWRGQMPHWAVPTSLHVLMTALMGLCPLQLAHFHAVHEPLREALEKSTKFNASSLVIKFMNA